ncbi:trypsin-like peptidase domain-containing protein [Streptomyces montanus]|uniref:Trypsin-like peptidase domain-containing protein n=1 Tax=Streptomyces montanus TaxID=2580423 RepID=A0A5R9FEJ6_9ACTN|nr:trypsin-like peptidase domain-containing protein [Streptomyces montanus]TLS42232.1 trypsin-like peptidase domain-containing protein [Streptomyces montanus]
MAERNPRLHALAKAATVHLLPAEGDNPPMWGSGFFVAPGWVLTAAHVLRPHLAADQGVVFRVRGEVVDAEARLERWLITDPRRRPVPPEEDLALVRLAGDADAYEHECVWLADRAVRHSGALQVYGYRPEPPQNPRQAVRWDVAAEINGHDDTYGLIFKPDVAFPHGVSGGPLLDPATGAVVGLTKSRRTQQDGGMAVAISALRRFGDLYRKVVAAHDRWHGEEPVSGGGDNWVDLQAGAAPGGEDWGPADRREALGLLAALPPPPDAPTVEFLSVKARSGHRWAGETPELVSWRDGHGLLYEGAQPLDSLAFLRYLRYVEEYLRSRGGDPAALGDWIKKRLRRDPRRAMHDFVRDVRLPEALLLPCPEDASQRVVIPYPGPGEGPTTAVLLDPVIGSKPTRFFWQIWLDCGDGVNEPELYAADSSIQGHLPGELVQALRTPLGTLFRAKDREGLPVPLEVALPAEYFDTAVHRWRFDDIAELDDAGHVGARRRVVLRSLARRGEPDKLWADRWEAMTAERRFSGWRTPERGVSQSALRYQEAACDRVPVMCRPAGSGPGRAAMKLALDSGHGVALWHIDGHATRVCPESCDTLHAKAQELLGTLGSVAELPDRLRHIRQEISERRAGRRWAEPLALLYDDPRRPLPAEETEPVDAPL